MCLWCPVCFAQSHNTMGMIKQYFIHVTFCVYCASCVSFMLCVSYVMHVPYVLPVTSMSYVPHVSYVPYVLYVLHVSKVLCAKCALCAICASCVICYACVIVLNSFLTLWGVHLTLDYDYVWCYYAKTGRVKKEKLQIEILVFWSYFNNFLPQFFCKQGHYWVRKKYTWSYIKKYSFINNRIRDSQR